MLMAVWALDPQCIWRWCLGGMCSTTNTLSLAFLRSSLACGMLPLLALKLDDSSHVMGPSNLSLWVIWWPDVGCQTPEALVVRKDLLGARCLPGAPGLTVG